MKIKYYVWCFVWETIVQNKKSIKNSFFLGLKFNFKLKRCNTNLIKPLSSIYNLNVIWFLLLKLFHVIQTNFHIKPFEKLKIVCTIVHKIV